MSYGLRIARANHARSIVLPGPTMISRSTPTPTMNPYRNGTQTILQVLGLIGLWLLIGMVDEPIVAILGGGFCLLVWGANLSDKLRYQSKASPHEIRFPTQNDAYYRT